MLTFTLDTNCIIDLAEPETRPSASYIRQLANAHAAGLADVAFVAVSASERQQGDTYLDSYAVFQQRLDALGLSHVTLIRAIGYYDISYWEMCLSGDENMVAREKEIHDVLFPNIEFLWSSYAHSHGILEDDFKSPKAKRWRNTFCDRQMYWAHDQNKRHFFVTSDANFRKLVSHQKFPAARVVSPMEAVGLL